MNKGVEILLNRMDSHPDEFAYSQRSPMLLLKTDRWKWVIEPLMGRIKGDANGLPWLTDQEAQLLYTKLVSVQRDAFTSAVMRELLTSDPNDAPF